MNKEGFFKAVENSGRIQQEQFNNYFKVMQGKEPEGVMGPMTAFAYDARTAGVLPALQEAALAPFYTFKNSLNYMQGKAPVSVPAPTAQA